MRGVGRAKEREKKQGRDAKQRVSARPPRRRRRRRREPSKCDAIVPATDGRGNIKGWPPPP